VLAYFRGGSYDKYDHEALVVKTQQGARSVAADLAPNFKSSDPMKGSIIA
jgi:hypothetical protein